METFNKYLPDGFYTAGNLNPTFDWEKQSIAVYDKYAILFGMIAMMYLPTVFGLKQYMENRKPYNLQVPLVCWNFGLAIFSLYGAIVTMPPALGRIQTNGSCLPTPLG